MFRNTYLKAVLAIALLFFLFPPVKAGATSIQGLAIRINDGAVLVSARLVISGPALKEIKSGMEKKIVFYVDLYRHWSSWPDEFIMGRQIERDLDCDSVKGEYIMVFREKGSSGAIRYESCNELISNALILKDIKLSHLEGLTYGRYYVRVTAQSRLMSLPPLLGQMFFFIRSKEFSVQADSATVYLGGGH